MFYSPDNFEESQMADSLKKYYNKLNQAINSGDLSDDDKFFVIYYFLELSQAIIRDFGDDFSKRLAKVILDTVDWFCIFKTWSLSNYQVWPQFLHLKLLLIFLLKTPSPIIDAALWNKL